MIRCINRLEKYQSGSIFVDGKELNSYMKKIDEVRHEVGMVFQQFNLLASDDPGKLHPRFHLSAQDAK